MLFDALFLAPIVVSAASTRTASNRRVFDGQANYLRWKNVRHKAPGAPWATGEWGVGTGGESLTLDEKTVGDFFDCPRESSATFDYERINDYTLVI